MRLTYKPGTVKKALLAFAGIGATGAVIKYKSHSQGHVEGQGGLEDLQEGQDKGLAWYLTEALQVTSGSAKEAGHTLAHVLASLRKAWAGGRVPALGPSSSSAGGGDERLSMPAAVAEFLSSMAEEPGGGGRGRVGMVLGGSKVFDWLLDAACADPVGPEGQAVERFLLKVLSDEEATCALLARPGALPKLLRLVAAEEQAWARAQALPAVAPGAQEGLQSSGGRLGALVAAAAHSRWLPTRAAQEDAEALLEMACTPSQAPGFQLLSLQLLTALAHTSVLNCTTIAAAGGGRRLAELASVAAGGVGCDGLQLEIARLMTALAANCTGRGDLRMSRWLYHLLCFAADASAQRDSQLAAASLQAFASCLRAGAKLQGSLMQSNALPLLHQLAGAQQAQQQAPGGGQQMRAAIASAVGALAESRGPRFPEAEREYWSELLLGWVGEQPVDVALQQRELLRALAGALAGLAAVPGVEGLHVAHAWLAELIVQLSRQLEAARSGPRWAPAAPGSGAGAGGTSSGSSSSSSSGSWWRFWGAPPSAAAAAAAADLEPAPAAGQGAAGAQLAQLCTGSEEEVVVGEAEALVGVHAAEPPQAAAQGGGGGGGGAGTGGAPAEKGWGSSWWWPWGAKAQQGVPGQGAPAPGGRQRPASDSELSVFLRAAPVGPLYARSVAAELLEASGRVGTYQEPPPNAEELMSPETIAAYARVAAVVDMEVADKALCQALKVLCALVSGDVERQRWLSAVGVLPLLHRLTISHPRAVPDAATGAACLGDSLPLCVMRQASRLLAMLSADPEGARAVRKGGWVPWLQNAAVSTDCKVSSCAARALLHLESAAAVARHAPAELLRPPWRGGVRLPRAPEALLPQEPASPEAAPAPGDVLAEARRRVADVRRRLDRQLNAVRPPVPPGQRLVLGDGVHLFDPLAPHHEVLAREGTASLSKDAPLVDVVFVHGIRGGAFATWRREGVLQRGEARENLERETCWPGAWLARELPEARLLSIEYPAPASGWEGESFPLALTAVQLMDKLVAAGVGRRPVVFVSHSMGGLVVKELLARAAADPTGRYKRLADSAAGAVFYSVPHFGAKLAAYGWQLRYVGGSPAAAVEQLRPGPHLDEINACIKAMCKSGRLPVLSFSEGQQTRLGYVKTSIVPHESAFPGYGEFVVLPQHDHINVCKPADQEDPAYARLADFLHTRVAEVRRQMAEEIVRRMDHMEPAL